MQPCPICYNPITKLKYKLTLNIYQCDNCNFQFCVDATFDNSFSSSLDEVSREKAQKRLRKDNFRKIVESIMRYGSKKCKGLEVGCGYGWFLEICNKNSIECEGIEPETRFNEKYEKAGLNVKNGFYPKDVSNNTKYDFIIFNDVFEHLPDLDKIMKTNYTLLNTKGLLIINLPIQEGLIYFLSKMAYQLGVKFLLERMWQFSFHSPHLSYFTKKNVIEFAFSNKFQLVDSYKLKTINLSEIPDRVKSDRKLSVITRFVVNTTMFLLYPFLNIFPDTYCFVFKKAKLINNFRY